jgi:Flp pilus assembly pilin Flp
VSRIAPRRQPTNEPTKSSRFLGGAPIACFGRDRRADTPIEYAMFIGLIALAVVGATHLVGGRIIATGNQIAWSLNGGLDRLTTGTVGPAPAAVKVENPPRSVSPASKRLESVTPIVRKDDGSPGAAIHVNVDKTPLRRGD